MHAVHLLRLLPATLVLAGYASVAAAQTTRSGAGASQAVQQLQQLAQERTALQTENARLKKELDTAQSELKQLRAESGALKAKAGNSEAAAARLKTASDASERALESSRQKLEELVGRFRELAQTLRDTESDRTQVRQQLDERSRAYDQCARANVELRGIVDEALTRYEKAAPGRAEVFTGIARVRAENLVDEYRLRVEELKIAAPPGGTTPK